MNNIQTSYIFNDGFTSRAFLDEMKGVSVNNNSSYVAHIDKSKQIYYIQYATKYQLGSASPRFWETDYQRGESVRNILRNSQLINEQLEIQRLRTESLKNSLIQDSLRKSQELRMDDLIRQDVRRSQELRAQDIRKTQENLSFLRKSQELILRDQILGSAYPIYSTHINELQQSNIKILEQKLKLSEERNASLLRDYNTVMCNLRVLENNYHVSQTQNQQLRNELDLIKRQQALDTINQSYVQQSPLYTQTVFRSNSPVRVVSQYPKPVVNIPQSIVNYPSSVVRNSSVIF